MKEGKENVDFFREIEAHQQKINYKKISKIILRKEDY